MKFTLVNTFHFFNIDHIFFETLNFNVFTYILVYSYKMFLI